MMLNFLVMGKNSFPGFPVSVGTLLNVCLCVCVGGGGGVP